MEKYNKIYILDSNIILDDAESFINLSESSKNLIVIPEVVLDEIDNKKNGYLEINYQARKFGRLLEKSEVIKIQSKKKYKIIKLKLNSEYNSRIDIISKEKYKVNKDKTELNIYNDRKILEISQYVNKKYLKFLEDVVEEEIEKKHERIKFISNDVMAKLRGISLGLYSESLRGKYREDISDFFIKEINLKSNIEVEDLNNKSIYDYDSEYKSYNFSYIFILPNERKILTTIQNERIIPINENDLRAQVISPKNQEQLLFSHALLDNYYNVVLSDAKAGSGKTFLSISAAMKMVDKKQYSKIIYIRNSIESVDKGEEIGYLSGNEAKLKIYNHPLYDTLDYIVRQNIKKSNNNKKGCNKVSEERIDKVFVQEKIEELIKRYNIETIWIGELRGRTLSDSYVIIDECQNMSKKSAQTSITRIDNTCKVVMIGSQNQIDNFYINKYTNGLSTLLNSTIEKEELVNIFAVKLKKVLRGPVTEWAEKVFSGS